MNTDTNDSNKSTEAKSTNLAETAGVVRGALDRLEDDADESRCEARVDEAGRFYLEDPENPEEAYLWSRETINIEVVR